jgi:hypothetical protein
MDPSRGVLSVSSSLTSHVVYIRYEHTTVCTDSLRSMFLLVVYECLLTSWGPSISRTIVFLYGDPATTETNTIKNQLLMRLGGGWFDRDHLSWHLCRGGGNPEASRASAEHEAQLTHRRPAVTGAGCGRWSRRVGGRRHRSGPVLGTGSYVHWLHRYLHQSPMPEFTHSAAV